MSSGASHGATAGAAPRRAARSPAGRTRRAAVTAARALAVLTAAVVAGSAVETVVEDHGTLGEELERAANGLLWGVLLYAPVVAAALAALALVLDPLAARAPARARRVWLVVGAGLSAYLLVLVRDEPVGWPYALVPLAFAAAVCLPGAARPSWARPLLAVALALAASAAYLMARA